MSFKAVVLVLAVMTGTANGAIKDKDCFDSPGPEDLTMCHEGCNEYNKKPLEYSCLSKEGNIACKCLDHEVIWFVKKHISADEAIRICDANPNCKLNIIED